MNMPGEETDGGFTTLSSRIAYRNRWTQVREDIIRRPDGTDGLYGVVERSDFVVIAALGADRRVTLIEQYRYPVRRRLWELPMGMWEERPDATAAEIANGELVEETGLIAASLIHVASLFQGPGYCNQRGHLFLATGLTQAEARREVSEQDMIARSFPIDEVMEMICDGRITCMATIAAFGVLRLKNLI